MSHDRYGTFISSFILTDSIILVDYNRQKRCPIRTDRRGYFLVAFSFSFYIFLKLNMFFFHIYDLHPHPRSINSVTEPIGSNGGIVRPGIFFD
jgi:hypothetical protein